MTILHDFIYQRPKSLEQAVALLAAHPGARPLAGGTDLLVNLKYRSMLQLTPGAGAKEARYRAAERVMPMECPPMVVSLAEVPGLAEIAFGAEELCIGPRMTMTELWRMRGWPAAVLALRDAAAVMGSPLIRNRATIGGNLVNARPAADTAVAAIALGAQIDLCGSAGTRTVPADKFILAPGKTARRQDELVVAIRVMHRPDQGSAYLRQGTRKQLEIALCSAAVWVALSEDHARIDQARICLGAVGPTPVLAKDAADALVGRPVRQTILAQAAALAAAAVRPIDDFRGSAAYRRHLAEVLTGRALSLAVDRAARAKDGGEPR